MTEPALHSGCVSARHKNRVLYVTLDRADKRNALTGAMYDDLTLCLTFAQSEAEVHAVLLDATGDMFCAGNDIADFAGATDDVRASVSDGPALTFIRALRALDKPSVVAVQGQATGIGTTLLLHADLVIAAESARFYTAFIDLALVPEAASSLLLPRLIGAQNAARLLLAGDTIEAETALRMGLVAYCVADAELADQAKTLATRLADKPPAAMRQTKQLIRDGLGVDGVETHIAREAERFGERLASDEVREIMARFLSRRR